LSCAIYIYTHTHLNILYAWGYSYMQVIYSSYILIYATLYKELDDNIVRFCDKINKITQLRFAICSTYRFM